MKVYKSKEARLIEWLQGEIDDCRLAIQEMGGAPSEPLNHAPSVQQLIRYYGHLCKIRGKCVAELAGGKHGTAGVLVA